ncbi:MAG TPA: hypothetical protein VN192_04665 [Flavobacterium sp.]|nr:hypothetical protein [Flavobacterium sp.]
MKKRTGYILLLIILIGMFLSYHFYNFLKVDACLDRGGRWNEKSCQCEF